jgi:hypothetical protein
MVASKTNDHLKELDSYFNKKKNEAMTERENKYNELVVQLDSAEELVQLKREYHNERLADLVLNSREINKIIEKNNKLIRKDKPIYMIPTSTAGRAHFYAPVKIIGNRSIDTLWFNILVIWIFSFILYLTLYYDLIRKVVLLIENIRLHYRTYIYQNESLFSSRSAGYADIGLKFEVF